MHGAFMPTLKLVREEDAPDDVRQVFNEIKEFYNLDFVPQEYQATANNPELLRENWELEKKLYEGRAGVDPKIMDIIGLVVASTRSCPYCINWHTAALKARGMSDKEILDMINVAGLFNAYATYTLGLQLTPDVTPDLADRMASSPGIQAGQRQMEKAA